MGKKIELTRKQRKHLAELLKEIREDFIEAKASDYLIETVDYLLNALKENNG